MYLIILLPSLSPTYVPREPDQQTPPLCYYSKVPTSEIHTIIKKNSIIRFSSGCGLGMLGMYTLRLTGCIPIRA